MKDIVISGKFLGNPINGIPRYAMEIVKRLDKLCETENIEICYPANISLQGFSGFSNITMVPLGISMPGWDYIYLDRYAKRKNALLLNLTNGGTYYPNSIICIHDIRTLTWDRENGIKTKNRRLDWKKTKDAVQFAKHLVTVSEFSKREIIEYFGVAPERIEVIPNGWEHILDIEESNEILSKNKIVQNQYYFSIGSMAPHKNFEWILNVAKNNPKDQFVVAGGINKKIWAYEVDFSELKNVIFLGYILDEELKALIKNCKAVIFPSYYEGFGIPPLEALGLGKKVIVSDIEVMKEVYGNSVIYINPKNAEVCLEKLFHIEVTDNKTEILDKYTWKNAASKWFKLIKEG